MRGAKFGLVISDLNMEPITGYELLKEVSADQRLKTTPFIMVTAESMTENVVAAKQAEVDNYNAETLKDKLKTVLWDF